MAARAIGSSTISFGLVAIPVKMYSTVDTTAAIHFNYLSKDGSRLKQQYIRSSDKQVVEREDRVQGYEFAKGQYVLFTPEEIKDRVENGLTLTDLRDMANLAGYQSSMGKVQFSELAEAKVPVIIGITIRPLATSASLRAVGGECPGCQFAPPCLALPKNR